jgi:hypothetical protein
MKPHNADDIRHLSDSVLNIAHTAMDSAIDDYAWQTLIAAGLELRRLANLPPPWADEPGCINKPL